jgi:hypothetical protein
MHNSVELGAVRHSPEEGQFLISASPNAAELDYRIKDEKMYIDRTYVPETLRGGGIAAKLVKAALKFAREKGLKVVPECSYVAVYLERHPEWSDLLR